MKKQVIPLSVPNLKGNELKYVTHAIETEWVSTGGMYVDRFEDEIANYVNCRGAVACQNGTSGLHISLLITGVTKDDAVIVPTLTFIAAVNPVRYVGAMPIFMDCDDSLCMDPVKLEEFCSTRCMLVDGKLIEKESGRHIKAVVVVHVFGNMADMENICRIASTYNLKVIEDATEALGTYYTLGQYKGKFAGTMGDVGVFSFNGNKIITTGGGGIIVSDNENLLLRAKHLTTQAKSDQLYYVHDEIGYNYRMTNMQAAMGIAQLEQIEDFIRIKRYNYELYQNEFKKITRFSLLPIRANIRGNYWFYACCCEDGITNRDCLIQHLSEQKIQSRPIWGLIHEQKPYRKFPVYNIEKAKQYWSRVVNIPCSSNLTEEDVLRVVAGIRKMDEF